MIPREELKPLVQALISYMALLIKMVSGEHVGVKTVERHLSTISDIDKSLLMEILKDDA